MSALEDLDDLDDEPVTAPKSKPEGKASAAAAAAAGMCVCDATDPRRVLFVLHFSLIDV